MLGHNTSLKCKRTEIISSIIYSSTTQNEVRNQRKFTRFTNMRNTLLSNQWVKEEIVREILKYFEMMKTETQHTKFMGCRESHA